MEVSKKSKHRLVATIHFVLWFVLIMAGIVAKRGFNHPDYVVFFHLPAAFFLVLGFYQLSAPYRKRNREQNLRFEQELNSKRAT